MRKAWLELMYQGVNISKDIAPDLLAFSFKEKGDKEADEISLTLADPSGKWQNGWAVSHGDILRPTIFYRNWYRDGDLYRLNCGTFELDEDELTSSGQGDTVTIKALPAAVRVSFFRERKSRTWSSANLARVAEDIAARSQLNLVYQADEIPIQRIDQRQESDSAFLQRLCTQYGCRMRVTEGNLVITSGVRADAAAPLALSKLDGDSLNVRRSKHNIYSSVEVTFTDPNTGLTRNFTYKSEGKSAETGKKLNINQGVSSLSDAVLVAKAALRDRNAKQQSANFSGQDRPEIRAGATVNLTGWGVYGGAMIVEQAEHSLSGAGAARCRLNLEKTLEY